MEFMGAWSSGENAHFPSVGSNLTMVDLISQADNFEIILVGRGDTSARHLRKPYHGLS